jgi:hypothetical protein
MVEREKKMGGAGRKQIVAGRLLASASAARSPSTGKR